jgi:hypothetical protein
VSLDNAFSLIEGQPPTDQYFTWQLGISFVDGSISLSGGHMKRVSRFMLLALGVVFSTKTWGQAVKTAQSAKPSFSITVSTKQEVIKIGSRCTIAISVKNIADHEITTGRILGELPFEMNVKDEEGKARPESTLRKEKRRLRNADPGGCEMSLVFERIKPGESTLEGADVNEHYDITKAGKYTIQVHRLDPDSQTEVRSNIITVTVTP